MKLADLLYISRGLRGLIEAMAIPPSLNPPLSTGEITVLNMLLENKAPCAIREIVAATGLAQSRVSTIVQSLKKRGWVVASTPAHDRRSTFVQATKQVIEGAIQVTAREVNAQLAAELPEATAAEFKAIVRGLETLAEVLHREAKVAQMAS